MTVAVGSGELPAPSVHPEGLPSVAFDSVESMTVVSEPWRDVA
jgi:hypothetical protein